MEYPSYTEELFYDRAGNRTRRIASGVEELYQYDPRNRLTAYTKGGVTTMFQYDHAGNLLADDKARYRYDGFNRTEKVETFDGHIQLNRYDAEGLRYEMEENGSLVRFIFNQNREAVSEEDNSGLNRLIRASELIAANSSADSARTYYHYASDEMGSTTHIVDEAGVVKNHYEYDAWGNITAQEEAVPNRFKFTGQQLDPITQQYYLRARFYNPVVARFTQKDTYLGSGLNLYSYCENNPVFYADPSGHSRQKCGQKTSSGNDSDASLEQPYASATNNSNAENIERPNSNGQNTKPVKDMTDAELAERGLKRYPDGSIRNSQGHFAGSSGTTPGSVAVDRVNNLLGGGSATEITVRVPLSDGSEARRRYDIAVPIGSSGDAIGIEVKSGTGRRDQGQRAKDAALVSAGGAPAVGKNATEAGIRQITEVQVWHVDDAGSVVNIEYLGNKKTVLYTPPT